MKPVSVMKLLLVALCVASTIHISASQGNMTFPGTANVTLATTSGQNNSNSTNTTLPSGFTAATTTPINTVKPETNAPIKPLDEDSSEEDSKETRRHHKKSERFHQKKNRGGGGRRENEFEF